MSQTPCVTTVLEPEMWDNMSEAARRVNVDRPLTRSSVLTREKAPMKTTRTCSVGGCERAHFGKGYCQKHWTRVWRTGTSDPRPSPTFAERLTPMPNGCIEWTGYLDRDGYGRDSNARLVHRINYEMCVGPIPDGFELDHLCHTNDPTCRDGSTCHHRRCVNPDHLEPVTHAENVRRRDHPAALALASASALTTETEPTS